MLLDSYVIIKSMSNEEIKPVEIKDLNKTQLILLAILLSFVVSIATGIVTVTLMQQASPAVNQTINRVVQHTIEKVVPDYTPGKTQTVVVKEDDLIVDAISKIRTTIINIYLSIDSTQVLNESYYFGDGKFISSSYGLEFGKTYTLSVNGKKIEAKVVAQSPFGFSVLVASKIDDVKNVADVVSGKDSEVRPGQTIAIVDSDTIIKEIVQSVIKKEIVDEQTKATTTWNIINVGNQIPQAETGSLVTNVEGEVVGMVVPKGDLGTQIVGIDTIEKALSEPIKETVKEPVKETEKEQVKTSDTEIRVQ